MTNSLSIIVPCYNEEKTIELFYEAIKTELEPLHRVFEIIFINDGSKDRTAELAMELHEKDSRITFISFSRNFGKEAAMLAGLRQAKGDLIVFMDADLQHPPKLLKEMFEGIEVEGYDAVACYRRMGKKGKESLIRRTYSKVFYSFLNRMSDIQLKSGSTDFRMMTRKVVDALLELEEYNRFSKGLFEWVGFKTKYLSYQNVERVAGKSSWNMFKLLNYALEGITSFSVVPLRFSMWMGILSAFVSFIYMAFVIIRKIVLPESAVPGFPTLISFILFLGGIILISLGLLGEYIGKIYQEVKKRPNYIVDYMVESKIKDTNDSLNLNLSDQEELNVLTINKKS